MRLTVEYAVWFGFMSEVDTRNRYATCEAIFPHHKWHKRCMKRLSTTRYNRHNTTATAAPLHAKSPRQHFCTEHGDS